MATDDLKIGDILTPEMFGMVDESYIIRGRAKTVHVEGQDAKWFVVQTTPQGEPKAERGLREKCFGAYSPKSSDWRKRSRKAKHQKAPKVKVHKAIFTGYVFAELPVLADGDIPFGEARGIDGIRGFVGTSAGPLAVARSEVEMIQDRESGGAFDATVKKGRIIAPRWAIPGASCQVVNGPFASFMALIEECLPNDRVMVAVNIFGRETPVELELDQIAAV